MTQTLHIFRKDIRHQWPELSIYAVLLFLAAVITPMVEDGVWIDNPVLPILATLLKFLLTLSWLLLTVRVVHEEALVGDRQFWTTRPYRWQSLFAAKALFIALCIALPFLTMQCVMATRHGLNPFNLGFLIVSLRTATGVWLPLFVVAGITSTLGTTFFSIIGLLVTWAAALTFLLGRDEPRTDAPYVLPVFCVLFTLLFVGILLYQYWQRNTLRTRIAVISVIPIFLGLYLGYVQMGFASTGTMLMHQHYPSNAVPELHMAFNAEAPHVPADEKKKNLRKELEYVTLPIRLDGLHETNRLINLNASYTVNVQGQRYTSPWRPVALNYSSISLLVPKEGLQQWAGKPAEMHVTLAGTELIAADTQTSQVTDRFPIAGDGVCNRIDARGNHFRCGFAFHMPDPIRLDAVAPLGCPPKSLQTAWIRTLGALTAVDPVHFQVVDLGGSADCRVASLRSTVFKPLKNFSTTLDIPSVNLAGYIDR